MTKRCRLKRICEACGEEYEIIPSWAAKTRFCSWGCRTIGMRQDRQREIERQFGKPIKELLGDLYFTQKLGIKSIAKRIGVSDRNLWDWFEDLDIERRPRSEAVKLQWVNNDKRRELSRKLAHQFFVPYLKIHGCPSKNPEAREKIRQSKLGSKNAMYGKFNDKNPNWKGGKVTYRGIGWRGIRTQILRRDDFTCFHCGKKFARHFLDVHHLVPYRYTQNNDPSNLKTVCKNCHATVEKLATRLYQQAENIEDRLFRPRQLAILFPDQGS